MICLVMLSLPRPAWVTTQFYAPSVPGNTGEPTPCGFEQPTTLLRPKACKSKARALPTAWVGKSEEPSTPKGRNKTITLLNCFRNSHNEPMPCHNP